MSATAIPGSMAMVPTRAIYRWRKVAWRFSLPRSNRRYLFFLTVLFGILTLMGEHPATSSSVPVEEPAVIPMASLMLEYYREMREDDRLLTLADEIQVKASNYEGVEVEGQRFYYRASPHVSMDPWSRGAVLESQVVIVVSLNVDSEFPMVIYRLAGR